MQMHSFSNNKNYYIQRMYLKHKNSKSPYSFDYMGSSEFEFGSLPKSIEFMVKNKQLYRVDFVEIDNKIIYIIIPTNWNKEEVQEFLTKVLENKYRGKESTRMDNDSFSDNPKLSTTVGWINLGFVSQGSQEIPWAFFTNREIMYHFTMNYLIGEFKNLPENQEELRENIKIGDTVVVFLNKSKLPNTGNIMKVVGVSGTGDEAFVTCRMYKRTERHYINQVGVMGGVSSEKQ